MFDQIDPARLKALLDQTPQPHLIDVRTAAEIARGVIAGAQHIEMAALPSRFGELDPEAAMVLYCFSGARSAQACAYLAQRGFANLYNLEGGFAAWVKAGLPVGGSV